MKIRNGFVSNSSSSSFIMLIPESFNVDEFDFSKFEKDMGYEETDEDSVKDTFKEMVKDGYLYSEDSWKNYSLITQIFSDFVITSIETGPDDGSIQLLNKKDILKIKQILST